MSTIIIKEAFNTVSHTPLGAMSAEMRSLTFIIINRTLTIFIIEHNATTWDRLSLIDQESVENHTAIKPNSKTEKTG